MKYLPCDKRQQLTQFKADGSTERIQRCTDQEAEKANLPVLPSDCEVCPLRRIAAAIQKPKPRLLGDVKKIVSSRPDREAADGFPSCPFRLLTIAAGCCNRTTKHRVCDSPDSYFYGAEVNCSNCNGCDLRGGNNGSGKR